MEQTHFILSNLTCGACAKVVKKRLLGQIPDIEDITVTDQGEVDMVSGEKISKEMIEEALADTDYKFVSFK